MVLRKLLRNFLSKVKISSVENSDHAIYNYTEAIKRNLKFVKAYNNRGIAYIGRQQYDLAIADFNKAIELDPKKWQSI